MGTLSCHSNQSSYPIGIKTQLFVPPTYRCYMCNMERIGLMASEEMSSKLTVSAVLLEIFEYFFTDMFIE